MAISIDWPSGVINVPKADTVLIQSVPNEVRQLNLDTFRLALKDLEDSDYGMAWTKTHDHNTTVTVAGIQLARVINILDPYTVTFEDGQYAVNLVGANSNVAEKTNVNQVSIRPQNSAGLTDTSSLQASAFQGQVALDITSSYAGTDYPIGLRNYPVNNLADAKAIADANGLKTILVLESMTLAAGDFTAGYIFRGDNPVTTTVTVDNPGPNVQNCIFENMRITGTLDGGNVLDGCDIIGPLNYVNGEIRNCGITGTVTLGGGSQASFIQCHSEVAGGLPSQTPTIDMGGSGQDMIVRGWTGGLKVTNYTGGSAVSMDMHSGQVVVDSTVTGGDIYIRGLTRVTDNSGSSAHVHDLTLDAEVRYGRMLDGNRQEIVEEDGSTWLVTWMDDGVTELERSILTDADGNQVARNPGDPIKRGMPSRRYDLPHSADVLLT